MMIFLQLLPLNLEFTKFVNSSKDGEEMNIKLAN